MQPALSLNFKRVSGFSYSVVSYIQAWAHNALCRYSSESVSQSQWSETFVWLSSTNDPISFLLDIDLLCRISRRNSLKRGKRFSVYFCSLDFPEPQTVPIAFSNRTHWWGSSSSKTEDRTPIFGFMVDGIHILISYRSAWLGYLFLSCK